MKKIRLFVPQNQLQSDQNIEIYDNDFNYLIKVMRKKIGDELLIFNGRDGEWLAKIIEISKKNCQIQTLNKIKEQYFAPKITLAFAPLKNVRIDFIATKATELGVGKFQPIITKHTIVDKINLERFMANVKEAAEQCERLDLPTVFAPVKLEVFLKNLGNDKVLILCDESGKGKKASEVLSKVSVSSQAEIVIFVGPEGGFSSGEFELFNATENLYRVTLGPRILRADTAIISSLTLVQEMLGDFHLKPNLKMF